MSSGVKRAQKSPWISHLLYHLRQVAFSEFHNFQLQKEDPATMHPAEAQKAGALTAPIADEDGDQQEFLPIAGRNARWRAHSAGQLGSCLKS